jgi:hypothetical protein
MVSAKAISVTPQARRDARRVPGFRIPFLSHTTKPTSIGIINQAPRDSEARQA